jgi:hypothetical protein
VTEEISGLIERVSTDAALFVFCLTNAQGRVELFPCPVGNTIYFFGFRGACARSDAIGPRSRFGVFGLRKSLPACDASLLDVVILFLSCVSSVVRCG